MNLKNLLRLTFLFAFLVFTSGNVLATDWYVNSTNGHDVTFDGSSATTPFKTIEKAISEAAAGDKIYVAGGTYIEVMVDMDVDLTFEVYEFQGISVATINNGIEINADVTFSGGAFNTTYLLLTDDGLTTESAYLVMPTGSAVDIIDGTISAVPTYEGLVDLDYDPTGDYTTGPELPADLDGGTLTVDVAATFVVDTDKEFTCAQIITTGAGTFELGADAELTGDLNNAVASFDLGGFQLVWAPAANLAVTAIGVVENGTVELGGSKTIAGDAAAGVLPNLVIPAAFTSTFTLGNDLQVDDFTLGADQAGAFTGAGFVLDVTGDFNRTDNTVGNFVPGIGGVLMFSGATDNTFDPGANLAIYDLNVTKGTKTLTMDASVEVLNDATIVSGLLDLDDYNIIMTGAGGVFTNGGTFYSTTLNGYVAFENATAAPAATITGAGIFGNILINLAVPGDQVDTGSDITISGILWVYQGTFNVGAGFDVDFTDDNMDHPMVKIFTTAANAADITKGAGGSMTYSVDVSLYYYGATAFVAGIEWTDAPTKLYNVDVRTTAVAVTGAPAASTISGELYVAAGATLTQGAFDYTLDGDGMTHTVLGTVAGGELTETGDLCALNGSATLAHAATINDLEINVGATGTFTSTDLQSANLITNTTGTSTVTMNMTAPGPIAGVVDVVVPDGTLTFDQGNGTITNDLDVNTDGTFILGADCNVNNDMFHTGDAVVDLNGFDLYLDNDYTHNNDAIFSPIVPGNTMENGAGRVISTMLAGGNSDWTLTTDVEIPNLEIDDQGNGRGTRLFAGDLYVTNAFYLTDGTMNVRGRDMYITGNTFEWDVTTPAVFNSGNAVGTLHLEGDALVITPLDATLTGNDPDFTTANNSMDVVVESAGMVTFGTDGREAVVGGLPYVYTIPSNFFQVAGDIAQGDNAILITGDFDRTAGAWTQGAADEDGWGFLALNYDGDFASGADWAIDNLLIMPPVQPGPVAGNLINVDDVPYTVNKVLWLEDGILTQDTEGNLTFADGVWIWRSGGALAVQAAGELFTWGATANLWYRYDGAGLAPANFNQGLEWPATADLMQTVIVDNAGAIVTLVGDRQINSLFSLYEGELDLDDNGLTIADAATWELAALGILDVTDADAVLTTTTYHLIYLGGGAMVSDAQSEFPDSATKILSLFLDDAGTNVTLDDDKTVVGPVTLDCGAAGFLDLNGWTLSVEGDFSLVTGFIDGGGALSMAGDLAQAFNVPAAGMNFPGAGADAILQIANTSTEGVTLAGGNLTMVYTATQGNLIDFVSGTFNTGDNMITLWHADNGVGPVQGFTRNVAAGDWSHIVGNVRKFIDATGTISVAAIALTRVEFPVGAAAASPGYYRPVSIQFNTRPSAGFFLTANHMNVDPEGTTGLPIETTDFFGNPMRITMYPAFYWLLTSSLTLQPQVSYDVEMAAAGYDGYLADGVENVKLIRRFDLNNTNPWVLQDGGTYDNSVDVDVPVIIVRNAVGAITTQGARFTYSIKSKLTAGTINDVVVGAPGDDWTFDLADWGVAGNAGDLTYTVTGSNPAAATAAIADGILTVSPVAAGVTTITVVATDTDGDFVSESFSFQYDPTTDIIDMVGVPTEYTLAQNYPNPFNPTTTLRFGLPSDANVVLKVYNVLGQEVASLINQQMTAGYHEVQFDASQLTSGLYVYRIEAGDFVSIKKMMLLK